MKNLFSVLLVVVVMFSLYSCGENNVSPTSTSEIKVTEPNQEDILCLQTAPIIVGQHTEDGYLLISYNSYGVTITFSDIPDNVSEVKLDVFREKLNGNPPVGDFSVKNFHPVEGETYFWDWNTFELEYHPCIMNFVYVHFDVGNETAWAGKKERRGRGRWLNWTEILCCNN